MLHNDSTLNCDFILGLLYYETRGITIRSEVNNNRNSNLQKGATCTYDNKDNMCQFTLRGLDFIFRWKHRLIHKKNTFSNRQETHISIFSDTNLYTVLQFTLNTHSNFSDTLPLHLIQ